MLHDWNFTLIIYFFNSVQREHRNLYGTTISFNNSIGTLLERERTEKPALSYVSLADICQLDLQLAS